MSRLRGVEEEQMELCSSAHRVRRGGVVATERDFVLKKMALTHFGVSAPSFGGLHSRDS